MVARPILLVEDNQDDEELCLRALGNLPVSIPIEVVRDGEQAVGWLFDERSDGGEPPLPRLILLDLRLPKLDGFQILQRIREDVRTRLIPVVILSSSDAPEDVRRAYELGANSFVCKPLAYSQYEDTLQRIGTYWLLTVKTA